MSNFDKKLDKATKHYKNKNYKEALKICDKILAKDYNNEKALELEGEILYKLDRIDEAVLNWKINAEYNNNPTAKMHLEDIDKSTKDKALSFDNLNAVSSTPEDEIEEVVNPTIDVAPKNISDEKVNNESDENSIVNNTSDINEDSKQDKLVENDTNIKEDIAITSEDDNNNNSNSETIENNNDTSQKSETAEPKTSEKKGKKSAIIAVCAIIVVVAAYAGVNHFKASNINKAETEQAQVNQENEKEIPKDFKENLDKAIQDKDINKIYTLLDEAPADKIPADDKDSYDKAIEIMKKDGVEKYYNDGLNDYKDKKFDKALENLSKAYQYSNDTYLRPHILYFMGATENALDKKDDSVKYFKEYLTDYPHSDLYTAEILYNLCLYYNDKGDKAEAKKYAQHLEDSYPSSPYYNDISKEILYN